MFRHLLRSAITLQEIEVNDDRISQPNASFLLAKKEIPVRCRFEEYKIAALANLARFQLRCEHGNRLILREPQTDLGDGGEKRTINLRCPLARNRVGNTVSFTDLVNPKQ